MAPGRARASFADFESLPEGFLSTSATIGGITFSNWRFNPGDAPNVLSIEDGSGWWAGEFPALGAYAQGKTLLAAAVSPGPNPGFTRIGTLDMSNGQVNNFASLNVVFNINGGSPDFRDYSGNTVGLRAFRNGSQVADVPVTVDTPLATRPGFNSTYGAKTITLSGVNFDALQLYAAGAKQTGGVLVTIDNVTIVPEPASFGAMFLAAGLIATRRRRRGAR